MEFEPEDVGGVEKTKEAFQLACNRGESNKADHLFLYLWDNMPPVEVLGRLIHKNMYPDLWTARNRLTALAKEDDG